MNQQSVQSVFWSIATEHRAGLLRPITSLDFFNILSDAKQQGISVEWRDIYPLLKLIDKNDAVGWTTPNFIVDFVVSYFREALGIGNLLDKKALDPCAGIGTFLSALHESLHLQSVGVISGQEQFNLARMIDSFSRITWKIGSIGEVENIDEEFDVIFSFPPFGLPYQNKKFVMKDGNILLEDTDTNFVVLSACRKLSSHGKAVFLLPETFYSQDRANGVVSNLGEFSLYINGVISLPRNSLSPWTREPTSLFLISRKKTDDLFVGHLFESTDVSTLINNAVKRKGARAIETGRLVSFDDYKSWRQYSLHVEVQSVVKDSKLPVEKIEQLAVRINIGDRTENGGFEDLPNVVYLPLFENVDAVTRISELKAQPYNYVQIVLKPEIALAEYVAGYFNTELGKKIRSSLAYGSAVMKLSKLDIMDAPVLLPNIDVQQKIVVTQRSILERTLGLEKLKKDLFKKPNDVGKIEKQITKLDQKESFENWIDSLPFPLATILWRYYASIDADEKIKHLLHFFEGTAQFMTTLMLSAVYSDLNVFEKHRKNIFSNRDSSTLRRSSFGNWITLGKKLVKITKNMLADSREAPICFDLYRTESVDFINSIANGNLFRILENTSSYRNNSAHGGIENALEEKRKLNLLESELNSLRLLFATTFDDFVLVKATSNQYRDGSFYNKISKIMGSRNVFASDTLRTIIPLDSEKLYFGVKDTVRPLEVLPFVKLISVLDAGDNACYFYNRTDGKQVRWVTYHYEQQPEINSADAKSVGLIKLINYFEAISE
jgi:hypothetical protein